MISSLRTMNFNECQKRSQSSDICDENHNKIPTKLHIPITVLFVTREFYWKYVVQFSNALLKVDKLVYTVTLRKKTKVHRYYSENYRILLRSWILIKGSCVNWFDEIFFILRTTAQWQWGCGKISIFIYLKIFREINLHCKKD